MAGQSTCALKSTDSYAKKVADRDQRGMSQKHLHVHILTFKATHIGLSDFIQVYQKSHVINDGVLSHFQILMNVALALAYTENVRKAAISTDALVLTAIMA